MDRSIDCHQCGLVTEEDHLRVVQVEPLHPDAHVQTPGLEQVPPF